MEEDNAGAAEPPAKKAKVDLEEERKGGYHRLPQTGPSCIIHCLETGDKLVANLAQIMGMSGTIRAMVEDFGADTAAEIPIAGVSGDVAKGILQFIEAYHDDGAACESGGAGEGEGAGASSGAGAGAGAGAKETKAAKAKDMGFTTTAAARNGRAGGLHAEPKGVAAEQIERSDDDDSDDDGDGYSENDSAPNHHIADSEDDDDDNTNNIDRTKQTARKSTGDQAPQNMAPPLPPPPMPESMMDLHRLGCSLERQQDVHWWSSGSDYIAKMVEAVEFLDMPKLMTVILTIVGKEVSKLAAKRMGESLLFAPLSQPSPPLFSLSLPAPYPCSLS